MAFPLLLPLITLAVAAVGTGAQVYGGIQQAKEQKKQNKYTKKQNRLRSRREKIQAQREAMRNRAAFLAQLGASGAGFGSSAISGMGQIGSTATESMVSTNQQTELGQKQLKSQNMESQGAMISSLGGAAISASASMTNLANSDADFGSIKNIFG